MIEQSLLQQVKQVFAALESQYTLRLEADSSHESYDEFKQFLTDFASTSDHLTLEVVETPGVLRMVLAKGHWHRFPLHPWWTRIHLSPPRGVQR